MMKSIWKVEKYLIPQVLKQRRIEKKKEEIFLIVLLKKSKLKYHMKIKMKKK